MERVVMTTKEVRVWETGGRVIRTFVASYLVAVVVSSVGGECGCDDWMTLHRRFPFSHS